MFAKDVEGTGGNGVTQFGVRRRSGLRAKTALDAFEREKTAQGPQSQPRKPVSGDDASAASRKGPSPARYAARPAFVAMAKAWAINA